MMLPGIRMWGNTFVEAFVGKLQIVKRQLTAAKRDAKAVKPQHALVVAGGAAAHGALLGATGGDTRPGIAAGLAAAGYGYYSNSPRVMMLGMGLLAPTISGQTHAVVAAAKSKVSE